MKNLYFLVFICVVLFSCNSENNQTITTINKWELSLDSAHQVFLTLDFDSLQKIEFKVSENERAIKRLNDGDTIYADLASTLSDYKWIRKKLKNSNSVRDQFSVEFDELKIQLQHLKTDVKNGHRTLDQNKQYLEVEIAAIKNLFDQLSNYHNTCTKAMSEYNRLNDKVVGYVEQLKRDKGIPYN